MGQNDLTQGRALQFVVLLRLARCIAGNLFAGQRLLLLWLVSTFGGVPVAERAGLTSLGVAAARYQPAALWGSFGMGLVRRSLLAQMDRPCLERS